MQPGYLLIFIFLISSTFYCQEQTDSNRDVEDRSFQYLRDRLDEDLSKQELSDFAHAYLVTAKKARRDDHIFDAYRAMMHHCSDKLKLTYADSMYYTAVKIKDSSRIASALLTKGILYYDFMEYARAIDYLLKANKIVNRAKDEYLSYKVKFNIGNVKMALGFYADAIPIFEQCVAFFGREGDTPYVSSAASLALCYTKMGQIEKSSKANERGLELAKKEENQKLIPYFARTEGMNEFFRGNYVSSMKKLSWALPMIIKNNDVKNEIAIYFYMGSNQLKLGNVKEAIGYFQKIDMAFAERNYVSPEFRHAYEILIKYWKGKRNPEKQLFYIGRLQKADSVTHEKFRYLSSRVIKEYDTEELNRQQHLLKEAIQDNFTRNFCFAVFTIAMILVCAFITTRWRAKKKDDTGDAVKVGPAGEKKEINPEIITAVLSRIEKFEEKKKFLEKDLTLVRFSAMVDCNSKYVSRIINDYKQKTYTEYINDLRIDYIVNLLKTEKKYRNYTFKALGQEAGFSTVQNFTRAFNNRMKMPVSEFLEGLGKEV